MDPASAIGVAAATVQFFAVGIKAIRLGKQICASKTGSTEANEALEASLKAISDIRKDLRQDITRDANSNIAKAQKQCLEIAEKLLKVLENIKTSSQSAKSKFLKDVSATWQVMRSRSKIDKLEQELRVARNLFKEALTVETRNAIKQVLENQGKQITMLSSLWDETQKLRPELQQARKENIVAHQDTLSGVARIEQISVAQHTSTQSSHQATLGAIEELDAKVQVHFNDVRVTDVQREILETLRYPDILTRQQEISPPATGTYEWVFTGKSPYQNDPGNRKSTLATDVECRQRLLHWFSCDEPLFWINGKPGSGKSSLMSFIINDQRTLQALQSWAGQRPVHIIKFFFWRPGSPLQRSVPGLLRSLLYQLLLIDTNVIDRLLAEQSISRHPTWEQVELLRILEMVLRLQTRHRICFFIDGLDEHDGDYMSLLDLILKTHLTSNAKICLSSRPESAFRLRLGVCPSISMQDLNKTDIETLVQQKLEPLGSTFTSLVEEVAERADGIVLWAALVCSSLLMGYTTYDDEPMLRKRLDEVPSGLRDLFRHMFSKIDNTHREYLRIYCHLLKWSSGRLHGTHVTSLSFITAVLQSTDIISLDHFIKSCAGCKQQIVAQSQGLIEVGKRELERDVSEKGLCSVRQSLDQGIFQSPSGDLTKELFEYSRHHIRWVHRSAHDCIFEEPGETIAPWITLTNELALRQKTVDCLTWLAEHSPMICIVNYKYFCGTWSNFQSDLGLLVHDIAWLTTHNEGYRIIGELHDMIASAYLGCNRSAFRTGLQALGLKESLISLELRPLLSLWEGVASSAQSSNVDRLLDKPFAALICIGLLCDYSDGTGETLVCRLLDCISRQIPAYTNRNIFCDNFLYGRQFGFRERDEIDFFGLGNHIVLSWLGSNDRDEADIIHGLAVLSSVKSADLAPHHPYSRVLSLMEARSVWRGPQASDESHTLLPLQLLLPNQEFLRWRKASQSPASPSLAISSSPFRLICMDRSERIFVSHTLQHQLTFKPRVVVTYELSAASTASLLSQSAKWKNSDYAVPFFHVTHALKMTWHGTAIEFSTCLSAILDDIWADRGRQLDAWQQLYALACVKLCFKRMWKVGDEADVARWLESDDSEFDNISVSASSSDEESENE